MGFKYEACNAHHGGPIEDDCGFSGIGNSKLEVFDWLSNVETPSGQKAYELVEVRFKNGRKELFRNINELSIYTGSIVVVKAAIGYDVGSVTITGELVRIQKDKKYPNTPLNEFHQVLRIATQDDIDRWKKGQAQEKGMMVRTRELAQKHHLNMKISDVEFQGDLTKATFYYTADQRVDFRQLIKDMAEEFKIKIEMRQIGARQEAARIGGIGACGRELCCSTWLTDFRSVSTSAARYQQLSLNPQKLAGQCGKLKCCLNFELDMYLESIRKFPKADIKLKTEKGDARHIKTDIFKKKMWYAMEGANSLIALTPERVAEIQEINKKGELVPDLETFEVEADDHIKSLEANPNNYEDADESFYRLARELANGGKSKNKRRNKNRNRSNQGNRQVRTAEDKAKSNDKPEQPKNVAPNNPSGKQPKKKNNNRNRNRNRGPRNNSNNSNNEKKNENL